MKQGMWVPAVRDDIIFLADFIPCVSLVVKTPSDQCQEKFWIRGVVAGSGITNLM